MREKFDRQLNAYYEDLTLKKEKEDDETMVDFENNNRANLPQKSYSQTGISESITKLEQLTENLEKVDQLNLPTIEMMLHYV
jgi:hypothetical protein